MKTEITERLWQLGVGMLTGWVVLDLFLLAVLKNGGRIESWHAGIWIAATFVGMWLVAGGWKTTDGGGRISEDGGRNTEVGGLSVVRTRWAVAGILTFVAVALPFFFSGIMGKFTDYSWDGMTSRGITVRNLMNGQPPMVEMSFGHVTAGFLAKLTGDWQGSKGINLVFIWICFCFVLGSIRQIGLAKVPALFLATLAALNPVSVCQLSSFQIDGHVASLFCCQTFAALALLRPSGRPTGEVVGFVMSFIGLWLSKSSGIFYGLILTGFTFLFWIASRNILGRNRPRLISTAAILLLLAAWFMPKINAPVLAEIKKVSDIRTPFYGVGGGAARVQEYINLPRPVLFAASAFSMTEGSPEKINLKPPFWTTRREIRIFEDLFPDPRAGGFGPFYSTALLLAGLGCLGLVAAGKWKYAPGWFLVLASFGSSYFSQIWWARWTPQNWLLVVGMLMTLVAYGFGSSRVGALRGLRVEKLKGSEGEGLEGEEVQRLTGWKGTWVRTFAVLGMIAAFLNVGIIALYYGIGMVRQERILDSQMYVASQLPQPLPIYLQREDYVFIASKYWLEERGISTREVAQNVDKPRMKINRTHTRFPLPENWRSLLRRPEDEKVLRERGLVEE